MAKLFSTLFVIGMMIAAPAFSQIFDGVKKSKNIAFQHDEGIIKLEFGGGPPSSEKIRALVRVTHNFRVGLGVFIRSSDYFTKEVVPDTRVETFDLLIFDYYSRGLAKKLNLPIVEGIGAGCFFGKVISYDINQGEALHFGYYLNLGIVSRYLDKSTFVTFFVEPILSVKSIGDNQRGWTFDGNKENVTEYILMATLRLSFWKAKNYDPL